MGDQTVHFRPKLTDEQRRNLRILSAYLRTLPAEYPDFEMDGFTSDNTHVADVHTCGTAACAAGHGPVAGIMPHPDEPWMEYSERVFVDPWDGNNGDNQDPWDWLFSASWSDVDNTAHGAAARIDYMLEHGVPTDALSQRKGHAPLSYVVGAA